MKRLILTLLVVFSALFQVSAQSLGYSVRGKVTDAGNGKPLESVSVSVPGKNFATVSNADGEFSIKSDVPLTELVFTHLGYRVAKVRVDGDYLRVKLRGEALSIDESVVRYGNARQVLQEAIASISQNYPSSPELLESFYRETVRKKSRYTYVSEAVARLYKTSYTRGVNADAAALEKSRVLLSQRRRDTLSVKMMGGPTQAVVMDPVKNMDVLLDPEFLSLYRMEMAPAVFIGDRPQYVVKISPGVVSDYALYFGTLYIDRETLAFTRMELSLDMSNQAEVTRMILVRKPRGLRFTPKEVNLTVSYRPSGGKYHLSYLKTEFRFNCDWKKRLVATSYTVLNELVVTDISQEAVPIPRSERFSARDALSEKTAFFQDPDFWKDYNIIEPTESLEHAIGKLKKTK